MVLAIPYVGLFIFTQWLFLSSKKYWKIKTQTTGRPMKKAVVGVAFATMLLSVGLVFSLLDLIPKDLHNNEAGGILGYIIFSLPIALWIVWSFIFTVYFFQKDYLKWSGKIIKGLIGGSILELLISRHLKSIDFFNRGVYFTNVFTIIRMINYEA